MLVLAPLPQRDCKHPATQVDIFMLLTQQDCVYKSFLINSLEILTDRSLKHSCLIAYQPTRRMGRQRS